MKFASPKTLRFFSPLFFVVLFCAFFSTNDLYAGLDDCSQPSKCGPGRIRSCTSKGDPQALQAFDPTSPTMDMVIDVSNTVCGSAIIAEYAAVKSAVWGVCRACQLNQSPSFAPEPLRDATLLLLGHTKVTQSESCAGAVIGADLALGTFLYITYSIYDVAQRAFQNTSLCGSSWLSPDPSSYTISKGNTKADMEQWIQDNPTATLANLNYRQWYYGGIEVEDNPESGDYCQDPTGSNVKSGGKFPRQKYYLRGSLPGNYNCDKYNPTLVDLSKITNNATRNDYLKAYNCCKKRSQNYACIVYKTNSIPVDNNVDPFLNNNGVFCNTGLCSIKGIVFNVQPLDQDNSRMLCVESYSLCPYNFTIGQGGTQYCDYFQDGVKDSNGNYKYITNDNIIAATKTDSQGNVIGTQDCNRKSEIRNADCTFNDKAGKCKNYCQYLTHCVVVESSKYQYQSQLGSPYFSNACVNFVGDSRNSTAFDSGIILGSQKHFSAPIAQCVKETMENVFYNRAGKSKCSSNDEYPDSQGVCASGKYMTDGNFVYKKGNPVKSESFFTRLQNSMQFVVKMALTLSIMFFGLKLLVAHNMAEMGKAEIIKYCIKIGLVMFFATGDAWQNYFFEGVYNASMVFAKMVFHIESNLPDSKKDGCQFDAASLGEARKYPAGKDYLAIWDTLDCKLARYLGYGPKASAANIAMLILAGLFTGPFGIYFALGLMFLGFFFLAMTLRALHIFLSSAMAIIIMVYISPIIIPTALFPKTEGIFKKWLENLISFCLQPMILFAYISTMIAVIDSTVIGSATFTGNPPSKAVSCKAVCKNSDGNPVNGDTDCSMPGHAWMGGICKDSKGNTPDDISASAACTKKGYNYDGLYCKDGSGRTISLTMYDICTTLGYQTEGAICKDANGNDVGGDPDCNKPGNSMVDPYTDSLACIIGADQFSSSNVLMTFGISIPNIYNLFKKNVKEKILTIVKAAFIIYIMYKLMDTIPSITSSLIGGAELPGSKADPLSMLSKVKGISEGIRGRLTGGMKKYGLDTYNTIKDAREKASGSDNDDKESSSGSASAAPAPKKDESSEGKGSTQDSSSGEDDGSTPTKAG